MIDLEYFIKYLVILSILAFVIIPTYMFIFLKLFSKSIDKEERKTELKKKRDYEKTLSEIKD